MSNCLRALGITIGGNVAMVMNTRLSSHHFLPDIFHRQSATKKVRPVSLAEPAERLDAESSFDGVSILTQHPTGVISDPPPAKPAAPSVAAVPAPVAKPHPTAAIHDPPPTVSPTPPRLNPAPPAASQPPPASPMAANAKWTGVVNQEGTPGNHEFSIEVTRQDGIAVCGILRFTFPGNACAIRFKGAVNGRSVNFTTYEPLKGNPTYPAIYNGNITGESLTGKWLVPSNGQKGEFQARRKNHE